MPSCCPDRHYALRRHFICWHSAFRREWTVQVDHSHWVIACQPRYGMTTEITSLMTARLREDVQAAGRTLTKCPRIVTMDCISIVSTHSTALCNTALMQLTRHDCETVKLLRTETTLHLLVHPHRVHTFDKSILKHDMKTYLQSFWLYSPSM